VSEYQKKCNAEVCNVIAAKAKSESEYASMSILGIRDQKKATSEADDKRRDKLKSKRKRKEKYSNKKVQLSAVTKTGSYL
jgi:hypothetical protein